MSDLVGNPEDRFSRVAAQLSTFNVSEIFTYKYLFSRYINLINLIELL